jgi:hypothetical protein
MRLEKLLANLAFVAATLAPPSVWTSIAHITGGGRARPNDIRLASLAEVVTSLPSALAMLPGRP